MLLGECNYRLMHFPILVQGSLIYSKEKSVILYNQFSITPLHFAHNVFLNISDNPGVIKCKLPFSIRGGFMLPGYYFMIVYCTVSQVHNV